MPFTEKIGKDIRSIIKELKIILKSGKKPKILVCYPDFPSKRTTISKIADELDFRLTNLPKKNAELVLFFHDQTHKDSSDDGFLRDSTALNLRCTDISKEKVDAVHQKVFGYNTFIDPISYEGPALEKSDDNAKHDGVIVQCPLKSKKEGKVYQIVIDNSTDDGNFMDLRVAIMGKSMAVLYHKFKTKDKRFTNDIYLSRLARVRSQLSEIEIERIIHFAREMKVDFAEFDLLRHKGNGRIYLVDVNTTPYGPPAYLNSSEYLEAINRLTSAFKKEFLSRS